MKAKPTPTVYKTQRQTSGIHSETSEFLQMAWDTIHNTACFLGSGWLPSMPATVMGSCPMLLASTKCWGLLCSWATSSPIWPLLCVKDSEPATSYQASSSLHDPFNPGLFTTVEALPSPVASHGVKSQAGARHHDPSMPSIPLAPRWLLYCQVW